MNGIGTIASIWNWTILSDFGFQPKMKSDVHSNNSVQHLMFEPVPIPPISPPSAPVSGHPRAQQPPAAVGEGSPTPSMGCLPGCS